MPVEMSVEMHEKLADAKGFPKNVFRIWQCQSWLQQCLDQSGDLLPQIGDTTSQFRVRNIVEGELGRAVTSVGYSAQLSPNVFTQIAFEMEGEVSGGIADSRNRVPEVFAIAEGIDFLKKAGKVAPVKRSQFS
jgi:hypothetical protein